MNTRREMALGLLAMPLAARAVETVSETNRPAVPMPESRTNEVAEGEVKEASKAEPRPAPPPYSVDMATIISYTIYAEARGEPWAGKMAVASVIKTRSMRSGLSMAEVCLQNKQFSCWNDLTEVPGYFITGEGIQPRDLTARMKCFGIAWALMVSDDVKWDYLTHFYNPDKATPAWAFELRGTRTIGRHVFGYID